MSDLLMWVGAGEHYPWPNDFADEAFRIGVSKRISRNSIPEIEPGVSRLALIHPKAIVKVTAEGMTLRDLAKELISEFMFAYPPGREDELSEEAVDRDMYYEGQPRYSEFTDYLREAEQHGDLKRIEEKYSIEYRAGVFGYAWLTGVHYCLKDDESELPTDLEEVAGIKAVRMDYTGL